MDTVDRFPPDDPREWLNRARSNLLRAGEARPDGVYLEDLCYDAQQAAEKAIKALLIARGIRYPYVHDLGALFDLLASRGESIPPAVRAAARLTEPTRGVRYPAREPVTDMEYEAALEDARAVVSWAVARVEQAGWVRERPDRVYRPAMRVGPVPGGGPDDRFEWAQDPEKLRDVVDRIVAVADPASIILFGSAARGEAGEHSDLDLLIVTEGPEPLRRLSEEIRQSLRGVGVAVDLVLATPADLERYGRSIGLVYLPALEEGRVVYEAPSKGEHASAAVDPGAAPRDPV